MIKKDYVLLLVEEFIRFVAKLLGVIREDKIEEAEHLIEKGYQKFLGIHFLSLKNESLEKMNFYLQKEVEEDYKIKIFADLLHLESKTKTDKNSKEYYLILATTKKIIVYIYIKITFVR